MTDYRQILVLLAQGRSYREIQNIAGVSHRTVAKAAVVMRQQDLGDVAAIQRLPRSVLGQWFEDGRVHGQGSFVPIDVDAVIAARTGRHKVPLRVLWARYADGDAPVGQQFYGYERFRKIVSEHVVAAGVSMKIAHRPGQTMQVDWAGSALWIVDAVTGRRRKVSVFVASMPYSGMVHASCHLDQKQTAWCLGHRLAFEYFGGVPEIVVPDNAATATNAISSADKRRQVNSTYSDFLEFYGTAAVPARPRRPRDKGNVEAGVKVVTTWVIRHLAGEQFVDFDQLCQAVAAQVDAINDRTPFRGQSLSRREMFSAEESEYLSALPDTQWQPTAWKVAKVAPNWHITVDTVYYSVPFQLIGAQVDVRITGDVLDVFHDGEKVAHHMVDHRRGVYVTVADHSPTGESTIQGMWTGDYFRSKALGIGPYTVKVIEALLASKPIQAQAYQPCKNVLSLAKRGNKTALEHACASLFDSNDCLRKPVSYNAVKQALTTLRMQPQPRTSTTAATGSTNTQRDTLPTRTNAQGAYIGTITELGTMVQK